MPKQPSNLPKHIMAMKLLVEWNRMYVFCLNRTSCVDCPYRAHTICQSADTQTVLSNAAVYFEEYLLTHDT